MKLFGLMALLAITTSGCVAMPTDAFAGWDDYGSPNSLVGKSPLGGGGVSSGGEVSGVTSALFQTSTGPVAWKGVQLARMLTPSPSLLWNAPPDNNNQALAVPKDGFGWAVGYGIARCEAGVWTTEPTDVDSVSSPLVASSQRIRLTDVSFASGSTAVGYTVGTRGTILKYDSVAKRWGKVAGDPATGQNLGTVKVLAANDVWVAGQVLLHFDGATWTKFTSVPSGVSGLAVVSPSNIWASTGSGLYQWNGTDWTVKFAPTGHAVGAPQIAAFGNTIVGLAIEPGVPSGAVFTLKDGAWQTETVTVPADVGLDSVVIASETTAYAKTYDNSGVYRFDLPTKKWYYYSE